MQKAMELNGKKVMGQELKLDMPRSKETAQEDKKGKDGVGGFENDPSPPFLGMHELFGTQACNVRRKINFSAMSSVPVRFNVCRFYPQSLEHYLLVWPRDLCLHLFSDQLTKLTNCLRFCLSTREGYKDSVCEKPSLLCYGRRS